MMVYMFPLSEVVLVVDDAAAVRAALKFALEVEGLRVQPAILIGARVSRHLRHCAEQAGMGCVLEKPLSDAPLIENLRGALRAPA